MAVKILFPCTIVLILILMIVFNEREEENTKISKCIELGGFPVKIKGYLQYCLKKEFILEVE